MKKIALALVLCIGLSSCATIFGGHISDCQKNKKISKASIDDIRMLPFILDICTGVIWLAVDFATGAIYKPCKSHTMHTHAYFHHK
jgi:hypothetical protein